MKKKEKHAGSRVNKSVSKNGKGQGKKTGKKHDPNQVALNFSDGTQHSDEEMELFFESRHTVNELVAPLGVNTIPLEYMVVEDNGVPLYTMCMYAHKLPRRSRFAKTYAPLFNAPCVTTTAFINPMGNEQSAKQLDKRIQTLGAEQYTAEQNEDRNRWRKITSKLRDAEKYAENVESGDDQLYKVAFLSVAWAPTLDLLRMRVNDLHMKAREEGIELHSCYAMHPEAFLSGYPLNRVYEADVAVMGVSPIKWHVLNRGALCDIFNHTKSTFSHKEGVYLGPNLRTGQPVFYDNYDKSHEAYGMCIAGMTGTGKSALIKMMESRFIEFGHKFRSIDFESRGPRGEYSIMAEAVGGDVISIKADSKNIINIFELEVEDEFDELTSKEYQVLRLSDKKVDYQNILMTLLLGGKEDLDFAQWVFIKRIMMDIITEMFEDREIYDGQPDSLYTTDNVVRNGRLQAGRVKKTLPTIHEFYKKALLHRKGNRDESFKIPFDLIISGLKDHVREMYYCADCMTFYTAGEVAGMETGDGKRSHVCPKCRAKIVEIHGVRPYFDGQSTVRFRKESPHINIDMSQVPKADKKEVMIVSLSFLEEHVVKKNSLNPLKTEKVDLLVDEVHNIFKYGPAREYLESFYRTARKRNVSPITATQALADYDGYEETKAIVKNATTKILFRQDIKDRKFLMENTPLTDSQINAVVSLGGDYNDESGAVRKGEMCLIDNNSKVVFLQSEYLTGSEAAIVETDMRKISGMYRGDSMDWTET